jgi:predicted DNA-binding transcriptional regulator YafY
MKIDRLLEIVIYLLNHQSATARQLAKRFGVSVRTIQRDMETISLAGIPLAASTGSGGGYSISDGYRLENQFVQKEDFGIIIMALRSLRTGYENGRLDPILDKYLSLSQKSPSGGMYIDYGVSREDERVQGYNRLIEEAIAGSVRMVFDYRNIDGEVSRRTVEPLALKFKWYAWYLFARDVGKEAYRTFKVARMREVQRTGLRFTPPADMEEILERNERAYLDSCTDIELRCSAGDIALVEEYFPDCRKKPLAGDEYAVHICVPLAERLWQALLLSFGGRVQVIAPAEYRERLFRLAEGFVSRHKRL